MEKIYIGSIDCAFDNTGCSICKYDRDAGTINIQYTEIIKKSGLAIPKDIKLKTFQDLFLASSIIKSLKLGLISKLDEILEQDQNSRIILGMEVQGGSQSARAAACLGMAKGILAATINNFELIPSNNLYYYEFTPNEVKKKVGGKKGATKDDIITWAINNYNQIEFNSERRRSYIININNEKYSYAKSSFEHIADSLVITRLITDNIEKEKK